MNPKPHLRKPNLGAKATRPKKARTKKARRPQVGDLCEATDGRAAEWRRLGCTDAEIDAFKDDSPFILSVVVPFLHASGFSESEILRNVPHDGMLAEALFAFLRLFGNKTFNISDVAKPATIPAWMAAAFLRRTASRRIAAMQNKAARSFHYEAEKLRRRAMAEERRRMSQRTTTSPCPTKEQVLEAWRHARDSKKALVRFGSMMQDLECYVDNSLRFDGAGRIIGRNSGVKGWLLENAPEMHAHYTTVIRYKAAAKKLRQIVGLKDPMPVAAVLVEGDHKPGSGKNEGRTGEDKSCNYGAEKFSARAGGGKQETPAVEIVRARAVYLEVMDGVPDVATRVMARIDALCDPERTDEAAMLRSWREKYERAITVRRKDSWWERLKRWGEKQRQHKACRELDGTGETVRTQKAKTSA